MRNIAHILYIIEYCSVSHAIFGPPVGNEHTPPIKHPEVIQFSLIVPSNGHKYHNDMILRIITHWDDRDSISPRGEIHCDRDSAPPQEKKYLGGAGYSAIVQLTESKSLQQSVPNVLAVGVGPLTSTLDKTLQSIRVARQAYHGRSFVGNHVDKCCKVRKLYKKN